MVLVRSRSVKVTKKVCGRDSGREGLGVGSVGKVLSQG